MSESLRAMIALALSGLLSACATKEADKPSPGFVNTHWELISIQSMDDAQGTTRIAQPEIYTASFGADGQASFRLNCNRGTASWKVVPTAKGDSGSIAIGPVAATRALCTPPHLDEKIVRDLGYVRSYLLRDGKLYLSLMADGGIYEWRPTKP